MPTVLKKLCIEAFERIHKRGVLHGDVELRHMLIGGDGKVTIIDFQMSRALVPNADVMLLPTTPQELKLEMRKVKYKLDYDGARKKEAEKMMRGEERRNGTRQIDPQTEANFEKEDIVDPPVHLQDWNDTWANEAASAIPARFVMPGQTPEALAKELEKFLVIVEHMSAASSERRQVRFASEVTSEEHSMGNSTHSYGLRKRKMSDSLASGDATHYTRFAKRSCSDGQLVDHNDEPIRSGLCADPVLVDYMARDSIDKDRFTPPRPAPSDATDSLPTNSSPHFPPIKVRDFAYEPYGGPRGYYAPYPLMESVVSLKRRQWIRLQNEQRCTELGLPPPRLSAKATTRSSNSSYWKQSKADRRITQAVLGLSKRQAVVEGIPAPTHKRKRSNEETDIQAGFAEANRYAKKVLTNTDHNNSPHLSSPIAGPSADALDPCSVQHPQGQVIGPQSQHHMPQQILGSTSDQLIHTDRTMPYRNVSSNHSTTGNRMAFATLGRLPPVSRVELNSKAYTRLPGSDASGASRSTILASSSRIGTPPRRRKEGHHPHATVLQHQNPVERCVSPSSEDEVEALLQLPGSVPSSLARPGGWMGFLLRWIQ